jgi:hypothetical protein
MKKERTKKKKLVRLNKTRNSKGETRFWKQDLLCSSYGRIKLDNIDFTISNPFARKFHTQFHLIQGRLRTRSYWRQKHGINSNTCLSFFIAVCISA